MQASRFTGVRRPANYVYAVGEIRSWGDKRNSADTAQCRHTATLVLAAMGLWDGVSATATCPLTGRTFNLADGQVDRVDPVKGYTFGNVVLTSDIGNGQRSNLPGNVLPRQAQYAADVLAASETVTVPTHGAYVPASVGRKQTNSARGTYAVMSGPYGAGSLPGALGVLADTLDAMDVTGMTADDVRAVVLAMAFDLA